MTRSNRTPALALHRFRPAIVDAKLMSDRQSRDPVYVAGLAEELHVIDTKMAAIERTLQIEPAPDQPNEAGENPTAECERTAQWIRGKCEELDIRLHRIQKHEERSRPSPSDQVLSTPTGQRRASSRWPGSSLRSPWRASVSRSS